MTTMTHRGILDTIQEALGFVYGVAEAGAEKAERLLWRRVAPALAASIVLSWLTTSYFGAGGLIFSMLLGFLGYFSLWFFVLRARNITVLAFLGATVNALTFNNPVRGAKDSVKTLLSITATIGLIFLFTHLVLWTWPFANNPGAFWLVFAAVIILTSLPGVPALRIWIMGAYTVLVLIMALYSTLGVYSGSGFDPHTGAPLHMVDPTTGQMDSLGRSPSDCTDATPCFSALSGEKLVPMVKDQAMKRSLSGQAATAVSDAEAALPGVKVTDWIVRIAVGLTLLLLLLFLIRKFGGGAAAGSVVAAGSGLLGTILALALIGGGVWFAVSTYKSWETNQAACPQNVRVPTAGFASIDLPIGCDATLDLTGLPIADRGLGYDIVRNEEAVYTCREPQDFSTLTIERNSGQVAVRARITPVRSAYEAIGKDTIPFRYYSRALYNGVSPTPCTPDQLSSTRTANPELAAALANAN